MYDVSKDLYKETILTSSCNTTPTVTYEDPHHNIDLFDCFVTLTQITVISGLNF
jgi:hypothetical protein